MPHHCECFFVSLAHCSRMPIATQVARRFTILLPRFLDRSPTALCSTADDVNTVVTRHRTDSRRWMKGRSSSCGQTCVLLVRSLHSQKTLPSSPSTSRTFQHVFTDDLTELVVSALATQGCDFLSTSYAYLCSYPYCMTAVCPVACGCVTETGLFRLSRELRHR